MPSAPAVARCAGLGGIFAVPTKSQLCFLINSATEAPIKAQADCSRATMESSIARQEKEHCRYHNSLSAYPSCILLVGDNLKMFTVVTYL